MRRPMRRIYIYIYVVSLMLVRAQDAIIVIKLTFFNDFDTLEWGRTLRLSGGHWSAKPSSVIGSLCGDYAAT